MVETLRELFDAIGIDWVLWLLIGLSAVSIAIMVERWLFFRRNFAAVELIAGIMRNAERDRAESRRKLEGLLGMEATVLREAMGELYRGPNALEEVVQSALAREKLRYDKYLPFLGTLGNNAPFIGLFGTVLGIISAFHDLEVSLAMGSEERNEAIMGSISEALVATAVGLLVAIPAVIAFNHFKGLIRKRSANTEALSRLLLAELKSTGTAKS